MLDEIVCGEGVRSALQGIDISPEYCNIANKRLRDVSSSISFPIKEGVIA